MTGKKPEKPSNRQEEEELLGLILDFCVILFLLIWLIFF